MPVPLIDVIYGDTVHDEQLRSLGELLPVTVAYPEEPWPGTTGPGDIESRFHRKAAVDVGELDVVIEERARRLASSSIDAQHRGGVIRERWAVESSSELGVWLVLSEGAWSQAQ